jgi:YVTN family beta-propeller protein
MIWAVRRRHGINEGPSDLVEVDQSSGKILGRPVRLESLAQDVDVGEGGVWVVRRRGFLVRVDPDSHKKVADIPVGRDPRSVAVDENGVWVANANDGTVSRVDPSTNRVIATISVGGYPDLVLAALGSVWVRAASDAGDFQKIDPSTNRVIATGAMELQAVGSNAVWVIGPGAPNGVLRRLEPTTLLPVGPALGMDILPASVGIAGRDMWVGKYFHYCELHNPIPEGPPIISFAWYRVHPVTLRALSGPVFVGSNARAPAFAHGTFWIAPDFGDELIKVDLEAAARVSPIPTPGLPSPRVQP